MNLFSRRVLWVFVGILILVGIFGWAWRHRESVPFVTKPLVTLTTPFQYGAARGTQELMAGISVLRAAVQGERERTELERENAELRMMLTSQRELLAENIRLRDLLSFQVSYPQYSLLSSHVIARDDGGWTQTILIDRGADDGVREYMPVLLPEGLVGFVSDVYPSSARVRLLIDPRTAVGGIVQRPESRVASMVTGNGNDREHPEMIQIIKEGDIVSGDTIVTSGYGGLYPKGIFIGTVIAVEPDASGVVKRAVLNPGVRFDSLEEVFVVLAADTAAPLDPADMPHLVAPAPQAGGRE